LGADSFSCAIVFRSPKRTGPSSSRGNVSGVRRRKMEGGRVEIEVVAHDEASAALKDEIRTWLGGVWTKVPGGIEWAHPEWHVLLALDGQRVSHVGIVRRGVAVASSCVEVGGICAVTTKPPWRGRGYATVALRRAVRFVHDDLHLEFGLLECEPEMVPFYEQAGWRPLDEHATCLLPDGRGVVEGHVTMVAECTERPWPCGPIDLLGIPW
jgi:GNAT superfamily N-acetyltransferase